MIIKLANAGVGVVGGRGNNTSSIASSSSQKPSLPVRPLTATSTKARTATSTTTTARASSSSSSSSSSDPASVVAANPLFASNPAFAAVLADSLSRQGSEALVSGEERSDDDEFDKEGPIEEVLASCLRDQRQAVVQLEQLEKVVKAALERERKQFERLQFAFKKAGNDRAYAQSLAKLRKRDKEERAALEEELKRLRG